MSDLGAESVEENVDSQTPEPDLEGVLHKSLDLETIDVDIYRAASANLWKPPKSRFVFGGQIVSQAMLAATMTVPPERTIHSLHAYFLMGGNPNFNVIYQVDRVRDGATYTSRVVKALQNGNNILTAQASFKTAEETELQHQYKMPDVPAPADLLSSDQLLQMALRSSATSESQKAALSKVLAQEVPVEIRPMNPDSYMRRVPSNPRRCMWIRAKGHIGNDMNMHRCIATYFSDMSLLGTSLNPQPKFKVSFMTSLDHSMWFHNTFHADEWMLYETESPQAGGGRAITFGRLWRRDGVLAASIAQEGIVRGKL